MIVTEQAPPPLAYGASYWERCGDPFHADAMPVEHKSQFASGERRGGWMAIDWIENPVGWIPDGTEVDADPVEYVMRKNPFGNLSAYPVDSEKLAEHEGKDWRSEAS